MIVEGIEFVVLVVVTNVRPGDEAALDIGLGEILVEVLLHEALVGIVLAIVGGGRGHCLEHGVLTRGVCGHPGHRWLVAAALLATPAPASTARLGPAAVAVGRCVVHRVGVHHDAPTAALGTVRGERLDQSGAEALAGELHQSQRRHLRDLMTGAIPRQRLGQPSQHQIPIGLQHHVDEVDHDDAADIAQSQLPDCLLGRLKVVLGNGLLQVAARAGELAGVDVDDRHGLGAVDHQRAARW